MISEKVSVLKYWLVLAKCVSERLIFFPVNSALDSNFAMYIIQLFVCVILKFMVEMLGQRNENTVYFNFLPLCVCVCDMTAAYNIHALFQTLISSIILLPSGCGVLCYMLSA